MTEKSIGEYLGYTRPARLNKAINTLRGIAAGIGADHGVSQTEAFELANWISFHEDLRGLQPFDKLIPLVESVLSDGVVTEEERADILWACDHITGFTDYYDDITGSLQYLYGLAHGLLADSTLTDAEIKTLHGWLQDNEFLSGTYPFDEAYSMVTTILADGKITEKERSQLMALLGELVDFRESFNLSAADFSELKAKYTVGGICALCPEISFPDRVFVITGESDHAERSDFVAAIERLGGAVRSSVSGNTDYLIVGNAGNPCWAFNCCGRKIEAAVKLRKAGAKVLIVNENDFWDAVLDAK